MFCDYPIYSAMQGPIVKRRNKSFIESIEEIFKNREDVTILAAIVGRAHVPGMMQLLTKKYGWKELQVKGQVNGC